MLYGWQGRMEGLVLVYVYRQAKHINLVRVDVNGLLRQEPKLANL